ncbi:hypothetical protein FP026_07285 [Rhizobium tropici]|uniref:Uncharacterized protein n=1 Tax=Rhizobium tropici TaxID=398 RepID=A0A5B0WAB8_RHITR|nr:hypothetical protein [Rhizobium tropici]KAA1183823.1 hypothetical protein FP026_07285 [Rhizobium tropici]
MGNMVLGLLGLGGFVGFIFLAFWNSMPRKITNRNDETTRQGSLDETQVAHGSNTGHWSI